MDKPVYVVEVGHIGLQHRCRAYGSLCGYPPHTQRHLVAQLGRRRDERACDDVDALLDDDPVVDRKLQRAQEYT